MGISKGSRPLGNLGVDGRILLKVTSMKQNERAWTSFVWPRIGTTGLLLRIQQQTLGCHKMAERTLALSNYIGR